MERSDIMELNSKLWNFNCRTLNGLTRLYKLSLEVEKVIDFIEPKLTILESELEAEKREFKRCQISLSTWISFPAHRGIRYVGKDASHDFINILEFYVHIADKQQIW